MAYVDLVGTALSAVPTWAWVAVALACGALACLAERQRTKHWQSVARKARTDALVWEAVASGRARNAFGKKTVVAPQYHAPRAARP